MNGFVEYQRGIGGVRSNYEKLQVGVATVFDLAPDSDIESSNLVFLCSCDTGVTPKYFEMDYALDATMTPFDDIYHADLSYSLKEVIEGELCSGQLGDAIKNDRPIRITLQGFYGRSSLTHAHQQSGPSFAKTILAYASGIHSKFTCVGRQSTFICMPEHTDAVPILFNQLYNMMTVESNIGLILVEINSPTEHARWLCIVCTYNGAYFTIGHDTLRSLLDIFPGRVDSHPLESIIAKGTHYNISTVVGPIPIGKLAGKALKVMGDGSDRLSLSIHHNVPDLIWRHTPVWTSAHE